MHPDPERQYNLLATTFFCKPQSIIGRASLVFPPLQGPRLCLMMIELARWQIEAWQNQWSIFTLRMPHSGTLSSRWSSGGVMICGFERLATKTIPQGAPLPTEHSKITIVHRIGCSLNLSISYFCFFVFWEYGCGLLSMGKQSIDKLCRMSGHPPLQKARTFGLGSPRPASEAA